MSYGLAVYNANNAPNVSPEMLGGRLFVQLISRVTEPQGTVSTYTFNSISSHTYLRIFKISSGVHNITTSTVNGAAVITLTAAYSRSSYSDYTYIAVFTTQASEPDYGITTINDYGERIVSSNYAIPEFISRVTLPSTAEGSKFLGNGYTRYYHSITLAAGNGRNRVALWTIPESTNCWISGTSFINTSTGQVLNLSVIAPTGAAYNVPEAYIFALDGYLPSSDTYGLRLYNSNQQLIFDSGLRHLQIKGFETTYFNETEQSINSSIFTGSVPAILLPEYYRETWTPRSGQVSSDSIVREGVFRRVGSTLYSKIIITDKLFEDAYISAEYSYGDSSNLILGVDAQALGAGTTQPISVGIISTSGNTSCEYSASSTNSCNTTEYFAASYSGGNGNSVSFEWYLSNAPGFSISGGNTNSSAIVINNGGGTTNYTGILQCYFIQSGSTTALAQYSLSHIHTATTTTLTASLAVSGQTSSCSYVDSSASSCATSETHTVTTYGGNGSSISYNWSFISNPGGFSFSGSTTGSAASIYNSGGGTATYTCTTRCTITQSGTSTSIDQNVSHTHTAISGVTIINPLSCNGGNYLTYTENAGASSTYFYIYKDGTWAISADVPTSGNWSSPTGASMGDGYYVRFTSLGGSSLGSSSPSTLNTPTAWMLINTTRSMYVYINPPNNNNGTSSTYKDFRIEISQNASTVVSTTNVRLSASAYNGSNI